ncbi:MAG TPA: hypothetical protein VHC22_22645 [Pirellulales bacterium]|nr:hypothetical protein [Pirellulales bacterium]
MTGSGDWRQIPRQTLTLRGLAPDTALVFVADRIIPRQNIGFDVSISLAAEVRLERHHCDVYSPDVLADFYRQLNDLRQGRSARPTLSLTGLELTIYEHRRKIKTGTIAEVLASSCGGKSWPWPERGIGDRLLVDDPTAHCLRFAFKTSLVDPPHVDSFLQDIDRLLTSLRDAE